MTTLQKRFPIGGSPQHESHDNFFRPRDQIFLKPRDKNLAVAKSNSQRPFYHSSDFDSKATVQYAMSIKGLVFKETCSASVGK